VLHARQHAGEIGMNTFTLELNDSSQLEEFADVYSFVGEDASGSFCIRAGHVRFMTILSFGLARFRSPNREWQYVAMPGATLLFHADRLWIGTRRFVLDHDYARISRLLQEQLLAEEQVLQKTRSSLRRMEEELMRKLWQLGTAVD
jgi:F-type H+-transporting ATPase subunit epsilon